MKRREALKSIMTASFGCTEKGDVEFRKIGLRLGGGSGWVILGYGLQFQW